MPGGKYRSYGPNRIVPNSQKPVDGRRKCMHIVEEAKEKDFWIYDPAARKWYTPEEFKAAFDRFHTGFDELLNGCQVRDPQDGFKAGLTIIDRMIDDLNAFVNRIVNYYKKK